ncbi:MAG: hypothetical protein ABFS42_15750 [Candidatus Krumholzibacteriota bacterium]
MPPKYLLLIPISILTILLFTACSDDDPTTPQQDPDILLTLHPKDYFLDSDTTMSLVFASDPEGNVLDVAPWSGTSTVVLKNSDIHPETVSFTIAQHFDFGLMLSTQLGVPAGSVKTLIGNLQHPFAGSAEVTFLNAPECLRYRMAYNNYSTTGLNPFPTSQRIQIFGGSTDLFVRIDPVDAPPLGGWRRNLQPGDTDTLDFEKPGDVAPLTATSVQIPSGGDRIICSLRGTVETESGRTFLRLDNQSFDGVIPESVTLYVPEYDPSNLVTSFYQNTDGSPDSFYWQESTGPVPASFTNLEGELSVTSTSPDSVAFTTTSSWDRLLTAWFTKNLSSSWWVEGPAPIRTFALPRLPEEITELIPDYPRVGFALSFLEIYQDTTGDLVRSQGKKFRVFGAGANDPMKRMHGGSKAPRGDFLKH